MNGIGVDIVDLNRFDLKNERFIKHILSSKEYACFMKLDSEKRKREFLGGRFAWWPLCREGSLPESLS